jgi:hypothetical protein
MVGISGQDFASEFTPCADIGWRIALHFLEKDIHPRPLKDI